MTNGNMNRFKAFRMGREAFKANIHIVDNECMNEFYGDWLDGYLYESNRSIDEDTADRDMVA